MKHKKVLITGGGGFIGAHLGEKLNNMGAEITILDDLSGCLNLKNIEGRFPYTFIQEDIAMSPSLNVIIDEMDYVFHFATKIIEASITEPELDFETNMEGSFAVLEAIRRYGKKDVELYFSSSVSVYGPPQYPARETDRIVVTTPYAAAKASVENYIQAYVQQFKLNGFIIRLSNVYGPRQDPRNPYCGVVSKFIQSALDNKPFTIYGDGKQTRDYVYIDDCINAIMSLVLNKIYPGYLCQIGSGVDVSVEELATVISKLTKVSRQFNYVKNRPIDNVSTRLIDYSRLRNTTGWTPKIDLYEGLKRTIEWWKTNV